tara:strand:+ start:3167 stop:3925 length:759 start_codon:yes stop_codon:yes gene_type:complete
VIYDCSPEFEDAYDTLREEHPNTQWWKQQKSLFKDVWVAAGFTENKLICFFTDDGIMFSESPIIQEDLFTICKQVTCFSLRMGLNINSRSHMGSTFVDAPQSDLAILNDSLLIWKRTAPAYGSYWSYSLSVDGHIFRQADLLDMLGELIYLEGYRKWRQNPNELEAALQRFWTSGRQYMISHQNSVYVNSPNNRVSESAIDNSSGDAYHYSDKHLLQLFTEGKRINLDLLDSNVLSQITCPHTEIDILKGLQ